MKTKMDLACEELFDAISDYAQKREAYRAHIEQLAYPWGQGKILDDKNQALERAVDSFMNFLELYLLDWDGAKKHESQ